MADVQLEYGFTRTANRLDEAITYADFTGTQGKIVRCIIRQTFGWQRLTVRIAHKEIADRCNLAFTGGFRRALEDLLDEGVLIEVERASGRTPGAYMLNKDFENWGRLSVPAKALERLAEERPRDVDDVLTAQDKVPPQGPSIDECPPGGSIQTVPPQGNPPQGGTHNSPLGGTQRPSTTTGERKLENVVTTREGETRVDGLRLVVAANLGLLEHEKRPQKVPRILPGQGWTVDAVEQLQAAEVPTEFAESAIFELAKAHRSDTEIRSLGYFVPATIRRWEEAKAAAQLATAPRPATLPSAPRRQPTFEDRAAAKDRERANELSRVRLEREYVAERNAAIAAWKLAHPAEFMAIVEDVKSDIGYEAGGPLGQQTFDRVVEVAIVEKHRAFPTEDEWLEARTVGAA